MPIRRPSSCRIAVSGALGSIAMFGCLPGALAQGESGPAASQPAAGQPGETDAATLSTIVVNANADASAEGLKAPYAGGQVARGGRIGMLGNEDVKDAPFNITSYTQELIQNQQAASVADVLQNDPSVRVARGSATSSRSTWSEAFRSTRTTWATTACTACCRANTSPRN